MNVALDSSPLEEIRTPLLDIMARNDIGSDRESPMDAAFKAELIKWGQAVRDNPKDRYCVDWAKFLYSPRVPSGFYQSGAEIAENLFSGISDTSYNIPASEVSFLERNIKALQNFFSIARKSKKNGIVHVSMGCGPYPSISSKDLIFARACEAQEYIAFDINAGFALSGASLIQQRIPTLTAKYIVGDFTKPFDLTSYTNNKLVVMTLFGDTIGQHPISYKNDNGLFSQSVSLEKLLVNFGKATNFEALLLATVDSETDPPSAEAKYQGRGMKKLMHALWGTAKEITGDRNFNPQAFTYRAEYDQKMKAVLFVHTATQCTSLTIDGIQYSIPKKTEVVIGCSQKTEPKDLESSWINAGWNQVQFPFNYDSTTRAILLAGEKIPKGCTRHCVSKALSM